MPLLWPWPLVLTTDHDVTHISTVPANKDQVVKLFVREREPKWPFSWGESERKPVLMLHGRSSPVLAGFDLRHKTYSWARALAKAGYDVFLMDLQGSGRSPRPEMADPCNLSDIDQKLLIPRPPGFAPCDPSYQFQLNNSDSDQAELHTVVEFIKQKCSVEKVPFVGWSAAAITMGPYAVKHPENVESLFLLAPIFPPKGTSTPPSPLPLPGLPMSLGTRYDLETGWNLELRSLGQREPGMVEAVWAAIMENEPVGSTWGPPEGVNRIRNFVRWGWNETTAAQGGVLGGRVPVLIVDGEHDRQANRTSEDVELRFSVRALYDAIAGSHKLMVKALGTGHLMPWERQHENLHSLSSQWIKDRQVNGKTTGVFVMDKNGVISPA